MKKLTDVICMRCLMATSYSGIDGEQAIMVHRASHVCADGVRPEFVSPFTKRERIVAGPGERGDVREQSVAVAAWFTRRVQS